MKHYVVFVGRKNGIFDNWDECQKQILGFSGAVFKSYKTEYEAESEFNLFNKNKSSKGATDLKYGKPNVEICSDSSYSIKTKILEYRVVNIQSKQTLSHNQFKDLESKYVNNIGEFFGLVKAVKYVVDNKIELPIYCDSVTAIKWVTERKLKTNITDEYLLSLTNKGIEYLKTIKLPTISKWQTNIWGEIPADFGRKK